MLPDASGEQQLVAYVVPVAGEDADPDELHRALAARLPAYMLPAAILALAGAAVTPNGKAGPPRPARPARTGRAAGRFHRSGLRHRGTSSPRCGARCSRQDRIGRQDDFFQLGGHSLCAPPGWCPGSAPARRYRPAAAAVRESGARRVRPRPWTCCAGTPLGRARPCRAPTSSERAPPARRRRCPSPSSACGSSTSFSPGAPDYNIPRRRPPARRVSTPRPSSTRCAPWSPATRCCARGSARARTVPYRPSSH
ncbi:hypothetical protein ACFSNO_28195, partial [Streptomyces cirratus]